MCTSDSKCQMYEMCTPKSDDFCINYSARYNYSTYVKRFERRVNGGRILLRERAYFELGSDTTNAQQTVTVTKKPKHIQHL